MIKRAHPSDRAERRRLQEYHEAKKHKGGAKARAKIRDEETEDELRSYRSGELEAN